MPQEVGQGEALASGPSELLTEASEAEGRPDRIFTLVSGVQNGVEVENTENLNTT